MTIEVQCGQCGKELKAPDSAVGKKAKCPVCGTIMIVPQPLEVIPDDVELQPPPTANDDPYGLGGLLDEEQAYQLQKPVPHPPAPEPDARRPCPACGEMIAAGAAKCRFCDEIFDHKRVRKAMKKARSTQRVYDDDDLSGVEMALGIMCGGIACILAIVWIVQGKPKGLKMLGLVCMMFVFWFIVGCIRAYIEIQNGI